MPATESTGGAASPGWFARLLMRATPLPALLHAALPGLTEQGHGRLQFIEDSYLPAAFQRALPEASGISAAALSELAELSGSSFFLHDRQPLRGGVILQKGMAARHGDALRVALRDGLRAAGRSGVRVLSADEFPALTESPGPADTRAAAVVIWRAEQPAFERWFGSRVADAGYDELMRGPAAESAPGRKSGDASTDSADSVDRFMAPPIDADAAADASVASARSAAVDRPLADSANSTGQDAAPPPRPPAVVRRPLQAVSPDPEPLPAAEDPTGLVHTANRFAYRVVGHTRGPVAGGRRYHIRRSGAALRIALLADEQRRLPAEDALRFFKELNFADDLIESHRGVLRQESAAMAGLTASESERLSLSLEVDCQTGQFRCVSAGIVPLFFRQQGGRLYALPQARAAENADGGLKTVAGRFQPGDALLIVPGGYTGSELRDLAGRHREILAAQLLTPDAHPGAGLPDTRTIDASSGTSTDESVEQAHLPAALAAWLDARLRGRGLFLQMAVDSASGTGSAGS